MDQFFYFYGRKERNLTSDTFREETINASKEIYHGTS